MILPFRLFTYASPVHSVTPVVFRNTPPAIACGKGHRSRQCLVAARQAWESSVGVKRRWRRRHDGRWRGMAQISPRTIAALGDGHAEELGEAVFAPLQRIFLLPVPAVHVRAVLSVVAHVENQFETNGFERDELSRSSTSAFNTRGQADVNLHRLTWRSATIQRSSPSPTLAIVY